MSALLIITVTAVVSFLTGWTLALNRIQKRQTARRELAMQLRSPLDLAPADFAREDWA
ncbi:hypothetical protein NKH73_14040 [Mesorhizobium sp. M0938]|uniref:hypothetical protein n=1 Tax=unclassified Mesorhizobium TaxID=325217 RepID=UPI00333B7B31